MDVFIHAPPKEKLEISDKLNEATYEAIRAGIPIDEQYKEGTGKEDTSEEHLRPKRRAEVKPSDEDELPHRNYRALGDRRMALFITGDQHRVHRGGEGSREEAFALGLKAPPLDFSFIMIESINELLTGDEHMQKGRSSKQAVKTEDDVYQTCSIRLSYNLLSSIAGIQNLLYKMLETGPTGLLWLDLACNQISKLDSEMLGQMPNLRILYLHGNQIADMLQVKKLKELTLMYSLTLHGNPIEQEPGYRCSVINYFPGLKNLDFFPVTKSDRANTQFARSYDAYWIKRHRQLEAKEKAELAAKDVSSTVKFFNEDDSDDDTELFDEGEDFF